MRPLALLSIPVFAIALALPIPSAANESGDGWSSMTSRITWTGLGVKREYRGVKMPIDAVYSGTEETAGNAAFTCYAGTLTAALALEPVNMRNAVKASSMTGNVKRKRLDMKIDGEALKSENWIYMPELKVYRARKKSMSAKLYNAVIRQSAVEIKAGGDDYVPVKLPRVDRVFGNFGSECGLGTAARK